MRHVITGTLVQKENKFLLSLFEGKFKKEFNNEKDAIQSAHDEMAKFFEINGSPVGFLYIRKTGQESIIQYDVEHDGEEWYECSLTDYWSLHPFYKHDFKPSDDKYHTDRSFYFMDPKIGLEIVAEDIIKTNKIMSSNTKEQIEKVATHCKNEYEAAIKIYK